MFACLGVDVKLNKKQLLLYKEDVGENGNISFHMI